MVPVTVSAHISASREELFDYLVDLGARVAFCDHWMSDFRLATPEPRGRGAAARYRVDAPANKQYVETQIVEADRPRRIVETTHGGRNGRTPGQVTWELSREGRGLTRVDLTVLSDEPATPREKVKERLGGTSRWTRRQAKGALERLRLIFEEGGDGPLARVSVAGWEPQKAPRFGASPRIGRG